MHKTCQKCGTALSTADGSCPSCAVAEKSAPAGSKDAPPELVPPLVNAEVNLPKGVEIRKNTADSKDDKKYRFRTLLVSWLSFAVAVLTFIALVVYANFSHGQLQGIREANTISRAALVATQRAFVVFQSIDENETIVRYASGETTTLDFAAVLFNAGHTPANVVEQYLATGYLPDEPNDEQLKGNQVSHAGFIGPNMPHNLGPISIPKSLLIPADINPYKSGKPIQSQEIHKKYFLWGWITYRDVLPDTELHVTEFCKHLKQISGVSTSKSNGVPELRFHFVDCDNHNCADKQCKDYQKFSTTSPN